MCSVTGGRGESSAPALLRLFSVQSKGAAVGARLPPVKTHNPRKVSAIHLGDPCCAFTGRADACVPCFAKIHCSQ